MRFLRIKILSCLFVAMLATACGSPGVPIPPSLELPRPVTDLHAFRKGNAVHLTWSTPTQTTEHRNLRRGGTAEVCRTVGAALTNCGNPFAQIPFRPAPRSASANRNLETYTDQITSDVQADPASFVTYAVSALNPYGRSAGLSNQVQVPIATTLTPPAGFRAQLTADGVHLSWDAVTAPQIPALRFFYRVYRRQQGSNKDAIAGELPVADQPTPGLVDHDFVWGKTYDYRVTVVTAVAAEDGTERQVEGDDTPVAEVIAHDVFPPAAPVGLQAVFSGPGQKPFIDLSWTPNLEPDLAGYNVYRREEAGQWAKLNSDPIKSPAFRDSDVLAGHAYSYSLSAIDTRGNESPRSEPASEAVP
jgi:hypothetical protein